MNKKTIVSVLIVIIVLLVIGLYLWFRFKASSYSGVVGSLTFPTVKTEKYTIETPGINPRVYEWDTKSGYHCIALFRDNPDTAPALQCSKKWVKNEIILNTWIHLICRKMDSKCFCDDDSSILYSEIQINRKIWRIKRICWSYYSSNNWCICFLVDWSNDFSVMYINNDVF